MKMEKPLMMLINSYSNSPLNTLLMEISSKENSKSTTEARLMTPKLLSLFSLLPMELEMLVNFSLTLIAIFGKPKMDGLWDYKMETLTN